MRDFGRLVELDAMRGLAALTVMIAHALYNLPDRDLPLLKGLGATPLRPLIDGRQAVIVFFVLSGLVLTRAFPVAPMPAWPVYAARRAIRLCLPAALAVLASAILYSLCHGQTAIGTPAAWPDIAVWKRLATPADILRQMALSGVDGDFTLDPVLWTLVHELRFSLLLPLVIAVVSRHDPRGAVSLPAMGCLLLGIECGTHGPGDTRFGEGIALSLGYLALPLMIFAWVASRVSLSTGKAVTPRALLLWSACLAAGFPIGVFIGDHGTVMLGDSLEDSLLATVYFAPCFLLGVALGQGALSSGAPCPDTVARCSPRPGDQVTCCVGGLALLSYDNMFATAAAALLLIRAATSPGAVQAFLRHRPLVFLGRISFSLYLVHLPLLLALAHGLRGVLPEQAISLLWLALSIPAAWGFHRIAERPAQALARRVGGAARKERGEGRTPALSRANG